MHGLPWALNHLEYDDPALMTAREVRAALGVSTSTIERMVKAGVLTVEPVYKCGPCRWFHVAKVRALKKQATSRAVRRGVHNVYPARRGGCSQPAPAKGRQGRSPDVVAQVEAEASPGAFPSPRPV
jgi:hypothetical protein